MINKKSRPWPSRVVAAGWLRVVALAIVVLQATAVTAGPLDERGDEYQWRLCPAGRLIPIRPGYTDPDTPPGSTEIRADASRLVEDGLNQFSGDVEVVRDGTSISAEIVNYDDRSGIFEAEGRAHLWESGLTWSGESATYDLNTEQTTLRDGRYWILSGRGRGEAGEIHHDRNADRTVLREVEYSTCPLSDEAWRVSASTIKLDHESDRGSATNAVLRIRDIPVFYFPYVNFPISDKRKSGFLAPTLGNTTDSGFDLRIPYYWNIAPNYDATITPRVLGDRGGMLETELRYLMPDFRGDTHVEYLPGDSQFNNEDRSFVALNHTHLFANRHGRMVVRFNNVSDDEYFEDFGSNITATSQRFLDRRIDVRYRNQRTRVTALVQSYQTIDDTLRRRSTPYRRLPRITLSHVLPTWKRFVTRLNAETTYFDRDDSVTGARLDVAPSVSYNFIKPYLDIEPRLTLRHTQYLLDDPNNVFDDNESRTLPMFSLDARLFAERQFSLFGSNHLQTFEPRLFYLLVPKIGQENLPDFDSGNFDVSFRNIFRDNRFSGGDRIGDANQVTAAVTSRVLDTETGQEAFRLSVGQIYYFRNREVVLPNRDVIRDDVSELIAEAAANITSDWQLRGAVQWDPNEPETEKSALSLRYRPNLETVVNLRYRFRRAVTDVEQTDVSFRIPVMDNLALLARWNFSLQEKQTLEAIAGIEYESCCWGLRVVGRRFLRNSEGAFDTGIFTQLEFRGLGGFGRRADSFLRRGIPGYMDPFD